MGECFKVVKDTKITGVAFSHDNGHIPSGVCAEIRLAQKKYKQVYRIDKTQIIPYHGVLKVTKKDRTTNWAKV